VEVVGAGAVAAAEGADGERALCRGRSGSTSCRSMAGPWLSAELRGLGRRCSVWPLWADSVEAGRPGEREEPLTPALTRWGRVEWIHGTRECALQGPTPLPTGEGVAQKNSRLPCSSRIVAIPRNPATHHHWQDQVRVQQNGGTRRRLLKNVILSGGWWLEERRIKTFPKARLFRRAGRWT